MAKRLWVSLGVLMLAALLVTAVGLGFAQERGDRGQATSLGTAFTYQGHLTAAGGQPINEDCSIAFRLYDQAADGLQVAPALTPTVPVSEGLFAVELDFGAVFTGTGRWLDIAVKCPGDTAYTGLGRQALTAVPYAHYALGAPWAGLGGVPGGFVDGVDDNTTYTAGTGLILTGTEMSVDWTAVAPFPHAHDVSYRFKPYQAFPTNSARGLQAMGSANWLAVANTYDGVTQNIPSRIYRWNGLFYEELQSIGTHAAYDWESFYIPGYGSFLAVANSDNGTTHNIDSVIYWWDSAQYQTFQSIPTHGARDWEYFKIGGEVYLAMANSYNDSSYLVDSTIYRWNLPTYDEFQSIPTVGALDWESCVVDGETYLAVANSQDGGSHLVDSVIYHWNGSAFVEFQSIPTRGAHDWECFSINGSSYLAVANHQSNITYNTTSMIYRWDGGSFVEFQAIGTKGARGWEFFVHDGESYLAVANSRDDSGFDVDSVVYHWDGVQFTPFQFIDTDSAWDLEFLSQDGVGYLAVANSYDGASHNIDSRIYRFMPEWQSAWMEADTALYTAGADVGIGTYDPQSALQVEGYLQLDTLDGPPPPADCSDPAEHGRMKVDVANNVLYICTEWSWTAWAATP